MDDHIFETNFFDTSVLICAANQLEENSNKAYKIFKQGDFLICHVVLNEIEALSKRRIKIYNSLLQTKSKPTEPIWGFIEKVINKTNIENLNDKTRIEQTFTQVLNNLGIEKETILSDTEWSNFELELNKVFHQMKNRLYDVEHSFADHSYSLKHVVQKYNSDSNHRTLLHNLKQRISSESRHHNDLWILANATVHAYKNHLFITFVSNDGLHTTNIKKIYDVVDSIYSTIIQEARELTVCSLRNLAG